MQSLKKRLERLENTKVLLDSLQEAFSQSFIESRLLCEIVRFDFQNTRDTDKDLFHLLFESIELNEFDSDQFNIRAKEVLSSVTDPEKDFNFSDLCNSLKIDEMELQRVYQELKQKIFSNIFFIH